MIGAVARVIRNSSRSRPSSVAALGRRNLNLHEYQSKKLMASYGATVQRGEDFTDAAGASKYATELMDDGCTGLVVKAQIHAGGRGKGSFPATGFKGGVHVVEAEQKEAELDAATKTSYAEKVRAWSDAMLGNALVTKQTGPEGQLVRRVLVHESVDINPNEEYYFAIVMDRAYNGPVLVASTEGGMDIEEVAESTPDKIHSVPVDIVGGYTDAVGNELGGKIGLSGDRLEAFKKQVEALYKLFIETDATQVEINPLVFAAGKCYNIDAKINFDDNAAFRQQALFEQRDTSMEDPREVAASKYDLNYIGLDGDIGCMVNGAGLAMATMDIIQLHGSSPANFLDVGGGATERQVEEAFKILTEDPKVKALLVNIFGGIMKCDVIATGIVNAAKNLDLKLPLVVRLAGTNVEKGNEILAASGLKVIAASDLDDAAKKAAAAAK